MIAAQTPLLPGTAAANAASLCAWKTEMGETARPVLTSIDQEREPLSHLAGRSARLAKRLAILTLASLGAGTGATAAENTWVQKGSDVLQICARYMPAVHVSGSAFSDAGFVFDGVSTDGSTVYVYSWNGRRVVAAVSQGGSQYPGCFVWVRRMSPGQAAAMAAPVISITAAVERQPTNHLHSREWVGRLDDMVIRIGLVDAASSDTEVGSAVAIEKDPTAK